jgi:hypothetical protein
MQEARKEKRCGAFVLRCVYLAFTMGMETSVARLEQGATKRGMKQSIYGLAVLCQGAQDFMARPQVPC